MASIEAGPRIIIPLDFPAAQPCLDFVAGLDPTQCRLKVGKELFTACGPDLVRRLQDQGFSIFLDLKFHDIPNTVAGAVAAAAKLGVWMVNVHASGGRAMLSAAREALEQAPSRRPLLIAVTVLTSLDAAALQEIGVADSPWAQVLRLSTLTRDCGLDGVVCSAAETAGLRANLGAGFCLVTPGIRRPTDAPGDQLRVVGPAEAIRAGSDFLVVGRPITRAPDPAAALTEFRRLAGEI